MARVSSFESIRKAALALPGVEESSAYGFAGFRMNGKLFVVFRRDLDSAAFRATFEQRDAMIAEDPETYYTTDHHRPYPWVLARVAKLDAAVVPDLLQMALRSAPAAKKRVRKK
jgi:hypothetical protein